MFDNGWYKTFSIMAPEFRIKSQPAFLSACCKCCPESIENDHDTTNQMYQALCIYPTMYYTWYVCLSVITDVRCYLDGKLLTASHSRFHPNDLLLLAVPFD